jgi:serine/threonine-protein kinase
MTRAHSEVAIKVLPPYYLHAQKFRERFEREALMIALLEHPAIVPVYDMGEEDGQPYIVMRYMSGGSLAEKIKKGPIPLRECMEMYLRLAPALIPPTREGLHIAMSSLITCCLTNTITSSCRISASPG